jgi:pantoate--beta-alanine ligase
MVGGYQQMNGYFYRMKIFKTIADTRRYLATLRQRSATLALVPTMGALHEGHLSLVRRSVEENQATGISIFVNPIQFNNPADLEKYPRTLESDLRLLEPLLSTEDFIFAPTVKEMYPVPDAHVYRFGSLETVMEGASRPGHFNGVGIVVNKLFRITEPDHAYFGEKDFQQLAIIRKLVEIEELQVKIIACPIIREPDGLAMSSRNVRLTPEHRKVAPEIYRSMLEVCQSAYARVPDDLKNDIRSRIDSTGLLVTEYIEFADESTLQPVKTFESKGTVRCFVAVQAGDVRLIDNLRLTVDD